MLKRKTVKIRIVNIKTPKKNEEKKGKKAYLDNR